MKRFIYSAAVFFVLIPALSAEEIESVTFNPSRLGRYEQLKITEKLDAPGGIIANDMKINTTPGGQAIVTSTQPYNVTTTDAKGEVEVQGEVRVNELRVYGGKGIFYGNSEITDFLDTKAKVTAAVVDADKVSVGISTYSATAVGVFTLGNKTIPNPSGCNNLAFKEQTIAGQKIKVLTAECPTAGGGEPPASTKWTYDGTVTYPLGSYVSEEVCYSHASTAWNSWSNKCSTRGAVQNATCTSPGSDCLLEFKSYSWESGPKTCSFTYSKLLCK